MSIAKAEELASRVYAKWRDGFMSTQRARKLLSHLPHCYKVDLVWGIISY